MPELDGFSAEGDPQTCKTPVLMLSARGEEYDRIHGFELGVDDYVVKPFSPKELMMRVSAIMNRVRPQETEPKRNVLTFQGLSIDLDARIVTVDGVRAELSPKEYDLLVYMAQNKKIALTREMLIAMWPGLRFFYDDRTGHSSAAAPRSGQIQPILFVTLRGVGYRFEGN